MLMEKQTQTCQHCSAGFVIDEQDRAFMAGMRVPSPTFCPPCRLRRRLSWINIRKLYNRTSSDSGKSLISMYSADKPFRVVEDKDWWGDTYDMADYSAPYDFSKSFFQQFRELIQRVPLPHLHRDYARMDNSEYCNAATGVKNCYLCMAIDECEDTYYSFTIEHVKNSADISFASESELCYECSDITTCYNVRYSTDCENCNDLTFCQDCTGCTSCIGCINLRNASYRIFNVQYSKEEYEKKLADFHLETREGVEALREQARSFILTQPHRRTRNKNNEHVSGDYIVRSKNVHDSYTVNNSEDCRYAQFLRASHVGAKNSDGHDWSLFGIGSQRMYEAAWCGLGCNTIRFSVWNYCFGCHSSQDLFGCIGLRKKKYCILNKQYTREEYDELVPRIIAHMNEQPYIDAQRRIYRYGEFFPSELSPFAYNETLAQDYLPLSKDDAQSVGFEWMECDDGGVSNALSWKELPGSIKEAPDSICQKPILCRAYDENPALALRHNCTRVFRYIPQEIAFYQKLNIPLPTYCHNSRHSMRMSKRSPLKTWDRTCMCALPNHSWHAPDTCAESFSTSYSPSRQELIYCEKCYSAVVY